MEIGSIVQVILFALLAIALPVIIIGVLKAVPRARKGKSYRYSKGGDNWILKYGKKKA